MRTDRILIVLAVIVFAAAAFVFLSKRPNRSESVPEAPVARQVEGELSLLVVGVKGFEESVVDRLIEAGRLPNIEGLMARGARGRFSTLGKLVDERIAWTSLVTGMAPENQGVGGKIKSHRDETMIDAPLSPEYRTVGTVWTRLSEQGSSCAVLGWPGTWPVEEIDGIMICPHSTYVLERSHGGNPENNLFPPSAAPVINPLMLTHDDLTRRDLVRFIKEDSVLGLESLVGQNFTGLADAYVADRSMVDVAKLVVDDPGVQNMFICLTGSDNANQRFWHYMDSAVIEGMDLEEDARLDFEKQKEALSTTVDLYCEFVDELVGELVELAGDGGTVAILTDNGYSGLSLDASGMPKIGIHMHSEEGFWVMAGPSVRAGSVAEYGSLLDVAPTVMAAASMDVPETLDGDVHDEVLLR